MGRVQAREAVADRPLSSVTFSGSGLNDLTVSGTYTGSLNATYVVVIDAEGTPDTFKWSNDGGDTYEATGVAITGSAQTLEKGISVTFAATTGHTNTESWSFTARKNSHSVGIATTSSTQILAAQSNRKYLKIENISDVAVWFRFDGETATAAAPAISIAATTGSIEFPDNYVPTGAVTAIHGDSGDKSLRIFSF